VFTKCLQSDYPNPAQSTEQPHSRFLMVSITLVPFHIRTHHIGVLVFVSLLENEIIDLKNQAKYIVSFDQQWPTQSKGYSLHNQDYLHGTIPRVYFMRCGLAASLPRRVGAPRDRVWLPSRASPAAPKRMEVHRAINRNKYSKTSQVICIFE
jgi:hypothetical protein